MVEEGEPLFAIETDKATLDVEAQASGVLRHVTAAEGDDVTALSTIALIAGPAEEVHQEGTAERLAEQEGLVDKLSPISEPARTVAEQPVGVRLFVSPRARRLAEAEAVPLEELTGSGPEGAIVERDVRAYLEERRRASPKATPVARRVAEGIGVDVRTVIPSRPGGRITRADVEATLEEPEIAASKAIQWVDMSPTRQTIARRMAESQRTAAEVTLTRDVDATELVHLRERILEELSESDPRPTYTDFLISIVALQLRQYPYLNATIDGERIGLSQEIDVAVAVDTDRGLLAPVLRNADQKGLLQLAHEREELVRRTRDGAIASEELSGGSFTITNMGNLGVDAFTPIINPPQSAILGVGRIRPGPAVHEGELCVRQLVYLSLTFDHRVVDGAPAARFLRDVVRLIEKPHLIWLGDNISSRGM
jgi:pyruvate dehydrogenase E2 component (dihydrolipoamide acetyltransferase)